jgi:hypothetical protein
MENWNWQILVARDRQGILPTYVCAWHNSILASMASSRISSLLVIATSKACLNVLILYTYVLKTCKWSSNPSKNDYQEEIPFLV